MPPLDFDHLRLVPVLVAALATFVLGALWYGPLFGKAWIAAQGLSPEQIQQMKTARPPALFLGGMLVSYLVLAFVVGLLTVTLGIGGYGGGALFGFLLWAGIAAPIRFTDWLASSKPLATSLIDGGYQLAFLLLVSSLVAGWR